MDFETFLDVLLLIAEKWPSGALGVAARRHVEIWL